MMIITLYKVFDLLLNAYREYKEFTGYSKKAKSKLKILSQLIMQVFSILVILSTSTTTGYVSAKIIKPLTKLLLLVGSGQSDLKTKMLKVLGFVASMTFKVKERFKL